MLNIAQETTSEGATLLKLVGDATIEQAEQLHQSLLAALKGNDHLQVDCSQTSSLDLYAIQLLCSAHRSSVAWKKTLTFHGTPTEPIKRAINKTGFRREYGCPLCPTDVICLWAQQPGPSRT